jgi:putative sterol carrier protein
MADITQPKEFFEVLVPSKFKAEKAVGVNCVVQMNIAGPNGGDWLITIKDQKLETKMGVNPAANVTVKMKDEDLVKMANGKLSPVSAYMTGKLSFKGDMGLGMKLQKLGIM